MKSIRLLVLVAASGLFASAHAQINYADIPVEFRPIRNTSFSVGVRFIGGANVSFGSLGSISSNFSPQGPEAGAVDRTYLDGAVHADSLRPNEKNADGTPISSPYGRYSIRAEIFDADGNKIPDANDPGGTGNKTQVSADFLAYTPGRTRSWSYTSDSQVTTPGVIAMHDYVAESSGAGLNSDSGAGPGFELTASRRLGSIGKIDWGIMFGAGITDINAKESASIKANLSVLTDLYRISGIVAPPSAPYSAPSAGDFVGDNGAVYSGNLETTVPLDAVPFQRTVVETANGADIDGHWQIKGAYFLFRVGPMIRIPIGERFAVTASAGYAGAYLGTTYRVKETLNISETLSIPFEGEETYSKLLHGAYGEVNAEWWLTQRTGFFLGVTFEKLGKYEQTLAGRTADVDIGGNGGFRFGLTTRF
ncbi:MAG: hypothetical protein KAX37_01880 [Opitutaceae bacterium]|nr:hypothetical protein [Opitutaceae bacterium]